MTPITKWTLLQRKISILWWSVGVFFLIFITLIFYPTFKQDADQLQESFSNLPDSALQLLGGSTDFFSAIGFLNSQLFFITMPLILGILAISLGSSLLAKEEKEQTIEMLLARPISRTKLLLAKISAGVLILTFVSLIGFAGTVLTARLVDLEVSAGRIFSVTLACYLMTLSFGAVAFIFTAIGRAKGTSIGIAITVAFGGYIVSSLAGTVDWLKVPAKVFPFEYYHSEAILRGTYNWANIIFFIAVITILGIFSWLIFKKRDLA